MGGSSSSPRKTAKPPSPPTNTSPLPPIQPSSKATTATPTWHNNGVTATTVGTTIIATQRSTKTSAVYNGSLTTRTSASYRPSTSTSLSPSHPVPLKRSRSTTVRASGSRRPSTNTSLSQTVPVAPKPASQKVENCANNYVIPPTPILRQPRYITPCHDTSCAKLRVCPQYNGQGCVAELCRRLHVCFHWVTSTCKKVKCKHDHTVDTLHNARLLKACRLKNIEQLEASRVMKIGLGSSSDKEEGQICMYNILKRCTKKPCLRVHSAKNYRWEVKDDSEWIQLAYHQSNYLEVMYSRPSVSCVDLIPLKSPLPNNRDLRRLNSLLSKETSWSVDLEAMELKGLSSVHSIRRLCTPSDLISNVSVATRWVWYWQDDDACWKPYGEGIVANVYHVALSDCLEYSLRVYDNRFATFKVESHHYRIDGVNLTQTNKSTGKMRYVRRRPACSSVNNKSVKFDELFLPFMVTKKFVNLQVVPQSSEFVFVENLLSQTMIDVQVASIHRVQNDHLWKVYQTKKRFLVSLYNGDAKAVNEQYLFHGTRHDVIDLICEENLDWKLSGTNVGRVYGCGTYFSNLAWQAHQYAQSDETGNKVMLVVLVLVGKMTRGHSGMTLPPVNVAAGRTFDTTCNSDTEATIFVKYHRDEYYPAYVVKYRCGNVTSLQ